MTEANLGDRDGLTREIEFKPVYIDFSRAASQGKVDVYLFRGRGPKRKIVNLLGVDREKEGRPNDWDRWHEEVWAGAWRAAKKRGFADSNYEKAKRPIGKREARRKLRKALFPK